MAKLFGISSSKIKEGEHTNKYVVILCSDDKTKKRRFYVDEEVMLRIRKRFWNY